VSTDFYHPNPVLPINHQSQRAIFSPIRPPAPAHTQTPELTSHPPQNPQNLSQNRIACGLTFGSEPAPPLSVPATPVDPAAPNDTTVTHWHRQHRDQFVAGKAGGDPFSPHPGSGTKSSRCPPPMHMHANLKLGTNGRVLGGTAVECQLKWSREC
jgi:hypothetical protein